MDHLSAHLTRLGITALNPFQSEAFRMLENNKDLLLVLPTGSGKSLIYELSPFLDPSKQTCTLIVMPLEALMVVQSERLKLAGYAVTHCNKKGMLRDGLQRSTHVFISPELLIPELGVADFGRVSHVFVDESHCVVKWGERATNTVAAFRVAYSHVGDLRAHQPHARFVAMTATATIECEQLIVKSLQMTTDYTVIRVSPEKTNIRYSVVKVGSGRKDGFEWIIGAPKVKTLVFFSQIHHLGDAYQYLKKRMSDGSVAMYHSDMPESQKKLIAKDFCSERSRITVALCSSAFSMGMNIPNLNRVIHYGTSSYIDEYMQETGRAGRDGSSSEAILLYHPSTLAGSNVSDSMKLYVKAEDCRRELMLKEFGETSNMVGSYQCCDNCARKIDCCSCGSTVVCDHINQICFCVKWCGVMSPPELQSLTPPLGKTPVRLCIPPNMTDQFVEEVWALTVLNDVLPENCSNIYPELVDNILLNHTYVENYEHVLSLGALCIEDAEQILDLIENYCDLIVE